MPAEKGIIQTILGNGSEGWEGDGGPALAARVSNSVCL